ncbi:RecX family transcriptional regulator [Methylobacterium haplocladii]|uniref:Recombinase RecX n=1 Tax=Methylobacterium haplocladii TaxID=1176176 RepID=A0A512IQW3_9HYPH|nr:RecX family transcriptional regulator [Methylobacterium haplocladii]GEP00114.1 recombinase RecX [Methylobacterium haplocladii]GJD85366.1 Regulatory protein RecX [Methylobacterium haplocladii]GLS58162.1 recombinase RecX [Methylobacterium haplocladii]
MKTRIVAPTSNARPAPPITPEWLERVALFYLDRYSATQEMLRRVLARRVAKRARARDEDPGSHAELIAEIVTRAVRAGLVDDARFTAARLATLRRRGASTRGAGAALAAKGVDRALVEAALAAEQDATEDESVIESDAARAYARRRRLGPHRRGETRAAYRERDLAAMARAGFSYPVAKAVIDATDEDLEA